MKIVRTVQSPKKLGGRFLFRIPVYIYRLGLGGIFGGRLLVLYHRGRVTGRQRQTVLEVVSHDITDDSYVVASGFGTSSMWYRNVIQTPEVSIQVGGRHKLDVVAMPVPKHEAPIYSPPTRRDTGCWPSIFSRVYSDSRSTVPRRISGPPGNNCPSSDFFLGTDDFADSRHSAGRVGGFRAFALHGDRTHDRTWQNARHEEASCAAGRRRAVSGRRRCGTAGFPRVGGHRGRLDCRDR